MHARNAARSPRRFGLSALCLVVGASWGSATMAQPATVAAAKAPVAPVAAPAGVSAFTVFEQWLGAALAPAPSALTAASQAQALPGKGGTAAVRFEPRPVILGRPELPLLGAGVAAAAKSWAGELNYQGLHARLLLLDARGAAQAVPLGTRLKPGQRFRIRLAATFDGVAAIDQVLGPVWQGQRWGQVYPATGQSVAFKAGQWVDLPVDAGQHFVLDGRPADERLLLTVRHARATGDAASGQPAYRQDSGQGSHFLQLVPRGQQPLIEALLNTGGR